MKANLKRKMQIAREILAIDINAEIDLDALNLRMSGKPRKFTVPLTETQIKRLKTKEL